MRPVKVTQAISSVTQALPAAEVIFFVAAQSLRKHWSSTYAEDASQQSPRWMVGRYSDIDIPRPWDQSLP